MTLILLSEHRIGDTDKWDNQSEAIKHSLQVKMSKVQEGSLLVYFTVMVP